MENLDDEEAQLLARLAQIKAEKAQKAIEDDRIERNLRGEAERIRREEELSRPVVIYLKKLVNNYIHVTNIPDRNDILELYRDTPGRMWKGMERVNAIPLSSYESFIKRAELLHNVTLEYTEGIKEAIDHELYAPDYICDLGERFFQIKTSRKAYTYDLRKLPGYNYVYERELHTVPLSEGWRLWQFSKNADNFVWTDKAKDFAAKQVENRLRLDEIAKATDVELEIPNLKATLKPFQRIGIKFFEYNGGRGILGDEMGTGKTIQMIGLIVHNNYKALVVCPAPLKENWLREIRKFAPHLTTYTCQGESPDKYDIANIIANKPDIVIINYDIIGRVVEREFEVYKNHNDEIVDKSRMGEFGVRRIVHNESRHPWAEVLNLCGRDLLILDEAHYIKNTDSNRSQAARQLTMKHAISLTGTPILNRPGELWAMLHLADPIQFPAYETFKRQYTYDGKTVKNVDELKEILKPLMIRRLKKDVIKELPPINRINSYYELSVKGRKLYDRVLAGVFEVLAAWNPNAAGSQTAVTNMLVMIQRLKQVVAYDGVEGTADLATEIFDASPEDGPPNKVLIFSQFKATTYAISKRLGHEALSFVSLTSGREFFTAQSTEQQALIDQFQSDNKIHYLCVTEKTAKEGHNITAAHAVIFNDLFWTPAGHQQAEARAYGRISDLHTIDSYYRIGINSISEKIMDLLAAKLNLIEQVVEGVEASRADSSIIHELLSSLKEDMWTFKKKR